MMTKWVAILLVVLAVLVFGLSQMQPDSESETASESARQTVSESVPEESESTASSASANTPVRTAGTYREPKFGVPGGSQESAEATPAAKSDTEVAAKTDGSRPDPFSRSTEKKPEPVKGTIKASILSTASDGPSRTVFTSDTDSIYVTATPEGLNDRVEVVASYRNVLTGEEATSEPVASSGPPRRRVFRLTPPADGWTEGPHQVILTAKETGQVLGLDRFELVDPEKAEPETKTRPAYLDLVPDLEAEKGKNVFDKTDPQILLRVGAPDLAGGNNIRTVWSAVEVDRLTSGELIAVSSQPAPGQDRDAIFTFQPPPGGYHSGSYKVDVYFNDTEVGSHAFFIQPPASTVETD